jgi:hypothetical protein
VLYGIIPIKLLIKINKNKKKNTKIKACFFIEIVSFKIPVMKWNNEMITNVRLSTLKTDLKLWSTNKINPKLKKRTTVKLLNVKLWCYIRISLHNTIFKTKFIKRLIFIAYMLIFFI